MRKKGFVLVAVIILILFVGVAILSNTQFVSNRFLGFNTWQRLLRCRYNAQAGIHYAIYQYRNSGTTYASGTDFSVVGDSNNTFRITSVAAGGGGGQSAALVIDARSAALASGNRNIVNDTVRNNSASAITVNQATITWTKTPKTLQELVVNGVIWWSGSASSSPAVISIANRTIPANTTYPITRIRFNSSVAGDSGVTISFRFSDNTTSSPCTVYPAQGSVCTQSGGTLTITSTGKTVGSSVYKTIQATYVTATGNISDYKELSTSVP
jgi:hypothetical protein